MPEPEVTHSPLRRPPNISADAFVAPSAVLVGDVSLAEGASVWYNAVLRADIAPIVVGRYSNVQDGSIVHVEDDLPTIIGDYVTIGHGAIVHGATIEDEVLIGMGAIVLSGAVIGRGCIVGAGALVTERAQIPPGSLVLGIPGKIVRQLGPEVAARHREHAEGYAALAREYQTPAEPLSGS